MDRNRDVHARTHTHTHTHMVYIDLDGGRQEGREGWRVAGRGQGEGGSDDVRQGGRVEEENERVRD